jgi:hypothetical protein
MRSILLTLFAVILLSSCESSVVRGGRNAYKTYMKENLKDPESLKIYSEKITREGDYTVVFDVEFGAKNNLGGYGRESIQFKTVGDHPKEVWVNGERREIKQ